MKKIVCLLVVFVMVCMNISMVVSAQETEEEKIVRVYNEVLTGNITNVEDVLDVAFEQMEMMEDADNATTYGARSLDDGSSLQITQVIDKSVDEAGNEEGTVAVTGLLLVDEDGRSVSAGEYRQERLNTTQTEGSLSAYSIRATITIYFEVRDTSTQYNGASTVKLKHMRTRLYYDSSYTATMMRHIYIGDKYGMGDAKEVREQSWIYSPTAGTYYYYPSNTSEHPFGNGGYIRGIVEIRYGTQLMTVGAVLETVSYDLWKECGIILPGW